VNAIPPLPTEISPDGREIWDWAGTFSEAVHRAAKASELRADIARVGCGGCVRWMTRQCPRERQDNRIGRSVGPSMNATTCAQYVEKPSTAELRNQRRAELAHLLEHAK
jgi:hypothetical protein